MVIRIVACLLVLPSILVAEHFSATVRQSVSPLLIRNDHNALLQLTIHTSRSFAYLESITVELKGELAFESLQFYSGGPLVAERSFGDRLAAKKTLEFRGHNRLRKGANEFWLSCRMRKDASLVGTVDATVESIKTSYGSVTVKDESNEIEKRVGVALRKHWDDGVHTYRIPALATTPRDTLLCVYDLRRRKRRDLQEDIDIGLLRSTDGGQTWEAQRVIMDMGTYGNMPQELNGISDPGIVVDQQTGEAFCFAVWMNGRAGKHQWREGGSEAGFEIGKSAQFMMVRSQDDGKTWSEPKNMTRHWKDPSWILYAPSPQQGITLQDGTLVMPTQGRDAKDRRFSNLLISKNHGETWEVSSVASYGNNECQAAELSDGTIMLNSRSLHPIKFRTVAVTHDLGRTWTTHATSRRTLIEPNCNGSLYRFDYKDGEKTESMLLFANPHSQTSRNHFTIQISLDDGKTWPEKHRLLLDEGKGNGYPSLSRIDDQHLGIVYEGSGAHLVFEKFSIDELLRR